MSKHSSIRVAALVCVSCVLAMRAQAPQQPINVSLVQLIATPEKYDGKLVLVSGFLDMGREGDLLFLHEEDDDNVILQNAIWVRRSEQMTKDKLTLNRKYVQVTGVFKVGYTEQLGVPPNGISDVRDVRFLSDPANPTGPRLCQLPGVPCGP